MENKVEHVRENIPQKTINNEIWYPMRYLKENFNWCLRTFNRRIEECLEWVIFLKPSDNTTLLGTADNVVSQRRGFQFDAYINTWGLDYIYHKEKKRNHNLGGWLYAFKPVTGTAIKVGKCDNLYRRLKSYTGFNTLRKCLWVKHVANRHTAENILLKKLQSAQHWNARTDLGSEWFDCDFNDSYVKTFLELI